MKIIQTKGTVHNGEVIVKVPTTMNNGEVDVVIIAEKEPDEFDLRYKMLKEKGYDDREKLLDLIRNVKLEMLNEKINDNV